MPSVNEVLDWVVKRISALTRTATDADLTDSEYMAVDNASAYTRKITVASLALWVLGRIKNLATIKHKGFIVLDDADGLGRMDVDTIFNNFAGKFDPTRTSENFYKPNEIVVFNGGMYQFIKPHYGDWNAADVNKLNIADSSFFLNKIPSSTASIKELDKVGMYCFNSSQASNFSDLPDGWGSGAGTLLVYIANSDTPHLLMQVVIKTSGKKVFKRYIRDDDTTAETWVEFTSNFIVNGNVVSDLSYTALSSCKDYGVYNATVTDISSITDMPSDFGSARSISLLVMPSNNTFNIQYLMTLDGGIWQRYSPKVSGNASDWVRITVPETFAIRGEVVNDFSYTTLQSCKEYGVFNVLSSHLGTITDKPSDFGSQVVSLSLMVVPNSTYNNLQFLSASDGRIWMRYSSVSGTTAGDWIHVNVPESFSIRGNVVSDLSYTALSSCKDYGVYNATVTDISSITDMPSDFGSARSISLLVMPSNNTFNIQYLMTLDGGIWQRYSPKVSGNASDWVRIAGSKIAKTKLAALGDSITQGYYSDDAGNLHGPSAGKTWPDYLGIINGWDVTNYGLGGSGYAHKATVNPQRDATEVVDNVDFTAFDIVTLAFGVNDWHYSCDIGDLSTSTLHDGTMVGNMRYCIEAILTENPAIKIVVIGPFNSSAFGGDFASNWGLGSSLQTSGTLQNVIDKIKSVCDYYNIQYIDCISMNYVNRLNIEDVLGDGLHPKLAGYLQIAKCFAKQLLFA